MGINVGKELFKPGIVYEDLIINLDALNPASYPGNGTTWYDTSGYNNHCYLSSSVFVSNPPSSNMDMNDANSYGYISQINNYPRTQLTLESVFYYSQTSGQYGGIVGKWISGNGNSNEFILGSSNNLDSPGYPSIGIQLSDNSKLAAANNTILMTTGQWYYQAATFDGTTLSLYLNGQFLTSSVLETPKPLANVLNTPFVLGGFGIIETVTGPPAYNRIQRKNKLTFGQFRMYKRGLSSSEISRNYNAIKGRFGLT
jgi:hypothetical protein